MESEQIRPSFVMSENWNKSCSIAAYAHKETEPQLTLFFEGLVTRQEEFLQNLAALHQEVLLKVETEWKSGLCVPYGKSLHSGASLHNTSENNKASVASREPMFPAHSLVASLAMSKANQVDERLKELKTKTTKSNLDAGVGKIGGKSSSRSRCSTSTDSFQIRTSFIADTFRDERIKLELRKSSVENRFSALEKFVQSDRFDFLTCGFVILNAFFVGVQVDYLFNSSQGEDSLAILIVDVAFCVIFLTELMLRMYVYGLWGYFSGNDCRWNRFDFIVIILSTIDTVIKFLIEGSSWIINNVSILRVVRSLRIIRSLRIMRVVRFFRDLRIMITAITSTLKTAIWAFLLLVIAMYVFGVAIAQSVGDYKQQQESKDEPLAKNDPLLKWFGSLAETIFTLFLAITGGLDYEVSLTPLMKLPMSVGIYIFFVVFSTFCVMNVLTGLFCQKAVETFERDKEQVIKHQLAEKERFVTTLSELVKEWDVSDTGKISKEEFEKHIFDQEVQILLRTLDVSSRDVMRLHNLLDSASSGSGVDLEDFVHACITLRGTANAVHMESVFIDSKIANAKLDGILRTLGSLTEGLVEPLPDADIVSI